VRRSLNRTWYSLALAVAAVTVVGSMTGKSLSRDLFPVCPGTLVQEQRVDAIPQEPLPGPGLRQPGGYRLDVEWTGLLNRGVGPHLEENRDGTLVRIDTIDGLDCRCGEIQFSTLGESWLDDTHAPRFPENRTLRKTDRQDEVALMLDDHGPPNAVARISRRSAKVFQPQHILTRRQLPGLVTLFAIFSLLIAALRARRAIAYAHVYSGYREGNVSPEGRVEDEDGTPLGTVDASARQVRTLIGPVLLAPQIKPGGHYREMSVLTPRDLLPGSHERWATSTLIRLRDARALSVLATLAAGLALLARMIGA